MRESRQSLRAPIAGGFIAAVHTKQKLPFFSNPKWERQSRQDRDGMLTPAFSSGLPVACLHFKSIHRQSSPLIILCASSIRCRTHDAASGSFIRSLQRPSCILTHQMGSPLVATWGDAVPRPRHLTQRELAAVRKKLTCTGRPKRFIVRTFLGFDDEPQQRVPKRQSGVMWSSLSIEFHTD